MWVILEQKLVDDETDSRSSLRDRATARAMGISIERNTETAGFFLLLVSLMHPVPVPVRAGDHRPGLRCDLARRSVPAQRINRLCPAGCETVSTASLSSLSFLE